MAERLSWENLKHDIYKNIPNLLTLVNLMLGVLAVICILEGQIRMAISLVFIAMLLDGLDGKLAVHLKTDSDLGKQLDSLADLVSFGVVPAILLYSVLLRQIGPAGLLVTLLFPLAGTCRLARFNLSKEKESYFFGLPITMAGGTLVSLGFYPELLSGWPALSISLILSMLMVSRIPYPSLKGRRQQEASFPVFIFFYGTVITLIVFLFGWREAITYLLIFYVVTGPLCFLYRLLYRLFLRKQRHFNELPRFNRGP